MNKDMLLDAVGKIDDEYILSAQGILDQTAGQPGKHRHGISRRFLPAAAIIVTLLISSFTVAMAANEDFRNAVFHFFRLSAPDIVLPIEDEPEPSDHIENIGGATLEDTVHVEYIRGEGIFDYNDGTVYRYDEETREITAAYAVENGQLSPLEPHSESLAYTWNDVTYQIVFDWYRSNDTVHTNAKSFDPATSAAWNVSAVSGSPDFVILTLSCGSQIEYAQYPLLYNLKTREVSDVLDGCEALKSRQITQTRFSPDLSRLLITCDFGSMIYCYDVEEKTLQPLSELSEMNVTGAMFIDNETILCSSKDENRKYTFRTVVMPSGECTEIFSSMPMLGESSNSGIKLTGGRYGVLVEEDRSTYVCDFKTGDSAILDGFKYPLDTVLTRINGAGNKLLFVRTDAGADGLGVSEIGVLDLEKRSFILFDREGYETRRENSIGWFDDDRVAIQASDEDNWYLYLFTVK